MILLLFFFFTLKRIILFSFHRVVFISGIVAGALLTILGIVTITGDTKDLFVCISTPLSHCKS